MIRNVRVLRRVSFPGSRCATRERHTIFAGSTTLLKVAWWRASFCATTTLASTHATLVSRPLSCRLLASSAAFSVYSNLAPLTRQCSAEPSSAEHREHFLGRASISEAGSLSRPHGFVCFSICCNYSSNEFILRSALMRIPRFPLRANARRANYRAHL